MANTVLTSQFLLFALIAVGVFTFYMAVVILLRKDKLRDRMSRVLPEELDPTQEKEDHLALILAKVLSVLGVKVEEVSENKEQMHRLQQAGLSSDAAVTYYLFFKRLGQPLLLILGVFFMLPTLQGEPLEIGELIFSLVATGIFVWMGLRGADVWVARRRKKRQRILTLSFPDALDLLLVCIESGLALDGALSRVCRELKSAHPEITAELDRTRIELTILGDRTEALQNLASRTGLTAFKSLVASLIQTEKFGTSLSDTLRVLSEDYRLTRLMAAENKAARLPALITVPLILFIMPSFMMIVLGPPFVRIEANGGLFGGATQAVGAATANTGR